MAYGGEVMKITLKFHNEESRDAAIAKERQS